MCDCVDVLVFLATCWIQDGLREEREELLKRLVDAFADVVDVTRYETIVCLGDGLLDLTTVLLKKRDVFGKRYENTRWLSSALSTRTSGSPRRRHQVVGEKEDTQLPLYMALGRVVRLHVLRPEQICGRAAVQVEQGLSERGVTRSEMYA